MLQNQKSAGKKAQSMMWKQRPIIRKQDMQDVRSKTVEKI